MPEQQRFMIFFGFWVVLAIANAIIIFGPFKAALKTAVWRTVILAAPLLMLGAMYWLGFFRFGFQPFFLFFVGALVLITVINLRAVAFCPKCGSLNRRNGGFALSPPAYCQKCGSAIGKT